jgi:hypothetical protein
MAERNTTAATWSTTPALYLIMLVLVNSMEAGFMSDWQADAVHDRYESRRKTQAYRLGSWLSLLSPVSSPLPFEALYPPPSR